MLPVYHLYSFDTLVMCGKCKVKGGLGMELQEIWNRFEQTGCVSDYLAYCKASDTHTNHFRNKYPSQIKNRTGEQYGDRTGRSDRDGADSITG
jgi:hypothetical protein